MCGTGGALAGGVEESGKLLTGGQRNAGLEGESSSFLVSSNFDLRSEGGFGFCRNMCVGSKISSLVSITMEGLRSQSGDSCGRSCRGCGGRAS